jgi:Flp pilus assembly protein TadG
VRPRSVIIELWARVLDPDRIRGLRNKVRLLRETHASQLAEFAVAMPLLVVLVVGIFDFGGAFTLKHKLASAAREGARFASNQSTRDLTASGSSSKDVPQGGAVVPASVDAVAELVGSYLTAGNVNDCGLTAGPRNVSQTNLSWTFTASGGGCPGPLTLVINRGVTYTAGGMTVEATSVSLQYAYKWHFNSVITLLVPGTSYAGITNINSQSTMQNLN